MTLREAEDDRPDDRGYVSARRVRPGVLFMVLSGDMREPFHTELIDILNDVWTDWFKKNKNALGVFPMLLRSKLLKMGVQVVNLATGELCSR